jgi:hypothetical protein
MRRMPRSLSVILRELTQLLTVKHRHDLAQELDLAEHALSRGSEDQLFRSIELLVRASHASGLTAAPVLSEAPVFLEAVQVVQMSGKPLPPDLPADTS